MPAKKVKSTHDPALAKPHADGTPIQIVQPLVHTTYGTLHYECPQPYARLYLALAHNCSDEAASLFAELIDSTDIGPSNSRHFPWDPEAMLLQRFLQAGYTFILFTYLAVEVYTIQLFIGAYNLGQVATPDWSGVPVMDRLRSEVPKLLSCHKPANELMADYAEIGKVRDAIMHPKPANLYDRSRTWDNVPLAWLLSERREVHHLYSKKGVEDYVHGVSTGTRAAWDFWPIPKDVLREQLDTILSWLERDNFEIRLRETGVPGNITVLGLDVALIELSVASSVVTGDNITGLELIGSASSVEFTKQFRSFWADEKTIKKRDQVSNWLTGLREECC